MCLGKPLTTSNYYGPKGETSCVPQYSGSLLKWRKSGTQADVMVADDHSSALRLSTINTGFYRYRMILIWHYMPPLLDKSVNVSQLTAALIVSGDRADSAKEYVI